MAAASPDHNPGSAAPTLVVGPSWVGDMVMAQSLFKTLAAARPRSPIDVLAPGWSLPVLARMAEVRHGIEMPAGHGQFALAARWRLGRELRRAGYARAIVLPRSLKSALVPRFAGIAERTGYRGELRYGLLNDIRELDKSLLAQTVQRYTALGLPRDAPLPPAIRQPELRVDVQARRAARQRLGLDDPRPVIGLMPGAEYGPAKQWPLDYYAELAAQLLRDGRQLWIFGGGKDREAGERIASAAAAATSGGTAVHNLAGQTSLAEAIDLIAACAAVVSNDSGLMHVAAAVGRPLVAIYGSSTPDYTPPLSDRAEILYLAIDCSPCFARVCPLGHKRCLKDIAVADVQRALTRLGAL